MPIPLHPPLSEGEAKNHDKQLQAGAGSAYRWLAAEHFGIPYTNHKRLDLACQFAPVGGSATDAHCVFKGWSSRGKRPGAASMAKVRKATGGAVDIARWRGRNLIDLAGLRRPLDIAQLKNILADSPAQIRECLAIARNATGRLEFDFPNRDAILKVRDFRDLPTLVALLALAGLGDAIDYDPGHALPAMCAYDIWPYVAALPEFEYAWEPLTQCLHRAFWQRAYCDGILMPVPLDRLLENARAVRADAGVSYTYVSGKSVLP